MPANDRNHRRRAGLAAGLCAAAVAGGGVGCAGDGPTISLKSDDPAGRIPAMKRAAAGHDRSALPALVDRLGSDDPAERLYASAALEKMTGQTLGYHYYGSDADRAAAVGRWRGWLAGKPAPGPATAAAAGPGGKAE